MKTEDITLPDYNDHPDFGRYLAIEIVRDGEPMRIIIDLEEDEEEIRVYMPGEDEPSHIIELE